MAATEEDMIDEEMSLPAAAAPTTTAATPAADDEEGEEEEVDDDEDEEGDEDDDDEEEEDEEEEGDEEEEEEEEETEEGDQSNAAAANRPSPSGQPVASSSSGCGAAAAATAATEAPPKPPMIDMTYEIESYVHPSLRSKQDLRQTFSWHSKLQEADFVAAPVQAFLHSPLGKDFGMICVGQKVEVSSRDAKSHPETYADTCWLASVLRISGYYVLLRYEGFGQDASQDFWIHLCSDKVHRAGWSMTRRKKLVPPMAIYNRHTVQEWREVMKKRLRGARTIPANFYHEIRDWTEPRLKPGCKLEVVDKMRICQMRVATIQEVTGGRLFLKYDDVEHHDNGFWCHDQSNLIHPVGWSRRVGHQIVASPSYMARCEKEEYEKTDLMPDLFPIFKLSGVGLQVGMKLEAVDPLNLATISVATVMKVLRFGYIMIRIDAYEMDATGSDWFCYHGSSPLIFAPGFSQKHNLKLKPPAGWENRFTWFDYCKETSSTPAPKELFSTNDNARHHFKVGMKLEAADQMDPRLICVSTISRVIGRLLKIHFDGWEEDYDQWMDCESVDIYPVGWAELVGHKLEGPRQIPPQKPVKRKQVAKRGKKRASPGAGNGNSSNNGAAVAAAASSTSTVVSSVAAAAAAAAAAASTVSSLPAQPTRKSRKTATAAAAAAAASPPPAATSKPTEKDDAAVSHTPPPPVLEPQLAVTAPTAATVPAPTPAQPPVAVVMSQQQQQQQQLELEQQQQQQQQVLKVIPRLVDSAGQAALQRGRDANLDPASWAAEDVAQFLEINECTTLVDSFVEQNVDGSRFLSLAKEDIMKLVNNKIGPCLKVENLLSLLRARMNPAQARYLANTLRKS